MKMILKQIRSVSIEDVFIVLTYIMSGFPLLTYGIRSVLLILWSAIGIILYFQKRNCVQGVELNDFSLKLRTLFLLLLPYLILILSLITTDNFNEGVTKLTQMLSMFIIPVIFFLNRSQFTAGRTRIVFLIFLTSVTLLVLFQIVISLINIDFLLSDLSNRELKRNNLPLDTPISDMIANRIKLRRFRAFSSNSVDTHTTYQGVWIAFSLFILVQEFLNKKISWLKKGLITIVSLLLLVWMLLLSTRMPLLAFLIGVLIMVVIHQRNKLKDIFILSGIILSTAVLCYAFISPLKLRIDEIINTKFDLPTSGGDIETYNSTNVRNGIYYCSYLVLKDNFLYGVGIGDVQDELNICYNTEIGAKIYTWTNYNSHNQYLYFFLCAGLLGGLVFLISFVYQMRISLKHGNIIYTNFLLLVGLIFLTENLLVRSDGVIFYAFFSSLLIFNVSENK